MTSFFKFIFSSIFHFLGFIIILDILFEGTYEIIKLLTK